MSDEPLNETLIEQVMQAMRLRGATFFSGGSRCHTTEGWLNGQWSREDFDEGHIVHTTLSEEDIRHIIRHNPAKARALLYADVRRAATEAMLRDDEAGVVAGILAAGQFDTINEDDRLLLALYSGQVGEAERAALRDKLAGHTLWHLFMNLTAWARTPENGRRGLAFLERVVALIGPPEPFHAAAQRASFYDLIGDTQGQIDALAASLTHPDATLAQRIETLLRIAQLHARAQSPDAARERAGEALALAEQLDLADWSRKYLVEQINALCVELGDVQSFQRSIRLLEASARRLDAPEYELRDLWYRVVKSYIKIGDVEGARGALQEFRRAFSRKEAYEGELEYPRRMIEELGALLDSVSQGA
jgi:hypothetical protein